MKSTFQVWNSELRSMTEVILNTSFWKGFTENGSSTIFTYFKNPCRKDLYISDFWCALVQICLFLRVFKKMTFYHYTLCADIFRANGLSYHSLYDCETLILYPCYISFSFLFFFFYFLFINIYSSFYFPSNLDVPFTVNLVPSASFCWGRG